MEDDLQKKIRGVESICKGVSGGRSKTAESKRNGMKRGEDNGDVILRGDDFEAGRS